MEEILKNDKSTQPDSTTPNSAKPNLAQRAALLSLGVNALLSLTKIVAGTLGKSQALIADGIESSMDILSSIIVLAGVRVAQMPPDTDHPFGHGKAESLAALFASLMLVVAGLVIIIQSAHGLYEPSVVPANYTLIVLLAIIALKEAMFRIIHKVGTKLNSEALKTDAWHHRSDAITSCAAVIGIAIALIGGHDYAKADEWAAIFAGIWMLIQGSRLLRLNISEVMDTTVADSVTQDIRKCAITVQGVAGVEKCHVIKSGFAYIAEIHVEVDESLTVRQGHDIAHSVKAALLGSDLNVLVAIVHIEPA